MLRIYFICISVFISVSAFALDPASYVDGHFPDGGSGRVFRGASNPFGMIMWGPSPRGYSLTFLSGAEMDDGFEMNLPVLPTAHPQWRITRFYKGFISKPESIDRTEPGYLDSKLPDGTEIEITTTLRTGMSRIHFPPSPDARISFSMDSGDNEVEFSAPNEIRGWITRNQIKMYFLGRFDHPFQTFGNWKNIFTHTHAVLGNSVDGAYVQFDSRENPLISMKIGVSFVSATNAALNLNTENPGWDFDAIKTSARAEWNRKLGLIEVNGTVPQMTMFYTHLDQVFLHPNIDSDVNGEYMGFDQKIHVASNYSHYANFSGWDIYRTWVQLVAWILPRETSQMVHSLLDDADACGGLPIWPVWSRETGTMAGGSATPLIASATAFGARDFDMEKAFQYMDHDESDSWARCQEFAERPYLAEYLKMGYIPVDNKTYPGHVSASLLLDYATDEFALSQYAQTFGNLERSHFYLKLSQNWKNIFNPANGFIQPKNKNGTWYEPFNPYFANFYYKQGFDEGNSNQWTWTVQHNLAGLFEKMGNRDHVIQRLDSFFEKLNDGSTFFPEYIGGNEWIGNEPGFGAPWEYNWLGAPSKTQEVVRRIINEEFMHWYVGDEDLGATSAWAVWASLGLYPEIAGVSGLTVTSPLFSDAKIHFENGKTLGITAENLRYGNVYIRELKLNGEPRSSLWIPLDLLQEGSLQFTLDDHPSSWGTLEQDLPPSFDTY